MFGLISMKSIRENFDKAMEKNGYIRSTKLAEQWGITGDQLQHVIRKGWDCDSFIVNGVRYISMKVTEPKGVEELRAKNCKKNGVPDSPDICGICSGDICPFGTTKGLVDQEEKA